MEDKNGVLLKRFKMNGTFREYLETSINGDCYISVMALLDSLIMYELCGVRWMNLKEFTLLGKDVSDSANRIDSKRMDEIEAEITMIRTVSDKEKESAYAKFGNIVRRWISEDSQ